MDTRAKPQNPEKVAAAIVSDSSLGTLVAAFGVAFPMPETGGQLAGGVFHGEHCSSNRRAPVGYKVGFSRFAGDRPAGPPADFIAGFRGADGKTRGRPVGVTADPKGAVILTDDLAITIWRVTATVRTAVTEDAL